MNPQRKKAIFVVEMEWEQDHKPPMTAQIARDKLLTPVQELWIMHIIDKFSIEEITQPEIISKLVRGKEEGERHSYYEKQPKVKKPAK